MKWKDWLGRRVVLAVLVGLYPGLFYTSNNWFIFEPVQNLLSFGSVVMVAFAAVWAIYGALRLVSKFPLRRGGSKSPEVARDRLDRAAFAFVCVGVLAYLLRQTLALLVPEPLVVWEAAAALLVGFGVYRAPDRRGELGGLGALGVGLALLCLMSLVSGLGSIATAAKPSAAFESDTHLAAYESVRLRERPNVYFIVPDAYPSRMALRTVFGLDDNGLGDELGTLGFTVYDAVFSNYMHTLGSISSSFGMQHHYYRGNIGNSEIFGGRAYIVSDRNPVVYVFRNNGYKVSYVHQTDYLFTTGCNVDLCSPTPTWVDSMELLPSWVRHLITGSRSLPALQPRALAKIDEAARSETPDFMYIHFQSPNHSHSSDQTPAKLSQFRSTFGERILTANEAILGLSRHILSVDPSSLIIVSGDHGAWGHGSLEKAGTEVFEGVADSQIALDHLGVQLAIRWPHGKRHYPGVIRSNVNIFRYVLAHLGQDDSLLRELAPDDGYIMRVRGGESTVLRAVRDGAALAKLEEIPRGD